MSLEINLQNNSISASSLSSYDDDDVECQINYLPTEILLMILRNPVLSDIEQAEAREVCRLWRDVSNMNPISDPHVTVYGKKAWETYFGYQIQGEIPSPPLRILEEVKWLRTQLKGEEEAPRCMLALIPGGLAFNELRPLMEKPLIGYATPIRYIWDTIVQLFGDKKVDETCWVLFTENVIEGSRGKSYAQQKELVKEKTQSRYALPEWIVVAICVALKHVKTGERILGDSPWTYTRCEETINGWPLFVGGFSRGGLDVSYHFFVDDGNCGVVACRKLK